MTLDADAQAIADLAASIPAFNTVGIEGAREIAAMASAIPPTTEIAEVVDRTIATDSGPVSVRIYHPDPRHVLPVLMYMHGGGWSTGDLGTADEACRVLAAKAQCVVVSVDYRLAPEHPFPAAFEDVYGVATWLAGNGAEIGADGGRIAIGGDSAGGNLAAAACLYARDHGGPEFALQLLVYPSTEYGVERPSMVEHANAPMLCAEDVRWFWNHYVPTEVDRSDFRAVPSRAESLAQLPPAFVITAEYDPIRDDGEAYGRALEEAGVDVKSTRYPGVFHGFFTMPMLSRAQEALGDAAEELTSVFARTTVKR
ncbi:alpha/beta hydrolase [Mycobacterium sp. 48b]|uniref:alpha/beta hydrolase n=1 Tax=Mycobacterium sp. 48b TaxID=3400426 RepID=UPI003AAF825F